MKHDRSDPATAKRRDTRLPVAGCAVSGRMDGIGTALRAVYVVSAKPLPDDLEALANRIDAGTPVDASGITARR
jgi:hypothetical protein